MERCALKGLGGGEDIIDIFHTSDYGMYSITTTEHTYIIDRLDLIHYLFPEVGKVNMEMTPLKPMISHNTGFEVILLDFQVYKTGASIQYLCTAQD